MACSRQCPSCEARWPEGWAHCPACRRATLIVHREPNRSRYQAAEADFERRYAEREERRIAEGIVAPEALGRRQARELLALERAIDN